MRAKQGIRFIVLIVLIAFPAGARVALDPDGLVEVSTEAGADSVTVGERFHVVHTFTFPDTLSPLPAEAIPAGNCRVVSQSVSGEEEGEGRSVRALDLVMMTLDLESARVPEAPFDFVTPSGDTLRVFTRGLEVPVRSIVAASDDLAPLKKQWEAPRSYTAWLIAGAAALALAALLWWWWRRRRAAADAEPLAPALPADQVALAELARIERMGLLDRGEHKEYYTRVIDVLREYIERRFAVEAMDRTSAELVGELERRRIDIEHLAALLDRADLVKFAKLVPPRGDGEVTMERARDIVVATRPVTTVSGNGGGDGSAPPVAATRGSEGGGT